MQLCIQIAHLEDHLGIYHKRNAGHYRDNGRTFAVAALKFSPPLCYEGEKAISERAAKPN